MGRGRKIHWGRIVIKLEAKIPRQNPRASYPSQVEKRKPKNLKAGRVRTAQESPEGGYGGGPELAPLRGWSPPVHLQSVLNTLYGIYTQSKNNKIPSESTKK